MGTLRLRPSIFALSAVQRQSAASRSARPLIRLQQGFLGAVPSSKLMRPLSTLAQTPSFRASIGHFPFDEAGLLGLSGVVGVGVGVLGVGVGVGDLGLGVGVLGLGVGHDPHLHPHAVAREKNMIRLRERKRATASVPLDVIIIIYFLFLEGGCS